MSFTNQLADFEKTAIQTITDVWGITAQMEHLKAIAFGVKTLEQKASNLGQYCFETLQNQPSPAQDTSQLNLYLINFRWSERMKSFLILWRDILFQQQKAHLLYLEGAIQISVLEALKVQSKNTIQRAVEHLINFIETETKTIRSGKKGSQRQIEQWQLEQNPWPIYRKQFADISAQCQDLLKQHLELETLITQFQDIQHLIDQAMDNCSEEMNLGKSLAQQAIDYIEGGFGEKPNKIALYLDDLKTKVKLPLNRKVFVKMLEESINSLTEKKQVFVNTAHGLVQFKELYFKKSVQQWLESEVLPVLYEVWELNENVGNGLKMSFLNIRNRAILFAAEMKEGKISTTDKNEPPDLLGRDICQPLYTFLEKANKWEIELSEFIALIHTRLKEEFHVTSIYHTTEDFLPISLQSTINQLKINQNEVLVTLQKWLKSPIGFVKKFQKTVEQEEALSISEKIVRCIQNRQGDAENHQYSAIFLTKGYIGESFWVGREQELQHAQRLIHQWRQGFRGSLLLTGDRLSGKSLFGDIVANRHFAQNSVRLSPNIPINIQGRRFTTTYRLKEALDFIRKYSLQSKSLVWIDDLELWQDVQIPLSENVRSLKEYIDDYSGNIFFLVSMNSWLKRHLEKTHELDKVFQAEINLNRMGVEEIRQAILIRHGATHATLVDESGKEITPTQFQKMSLKTYRAADGNIGEALNRWSYATHRWGDDKVIHHSKTEYHLPDTFPNPDTFILLATIILQKRTSEYRLHKLFGPPFKEKYSRVLQRLLSVGLLTRHLDGSLEINELAANDIGMLLTRKNYLL